MTDNVIPFMRPTPERLDNTPADELASSALDLGNHDFGQAFALLLKAADIIRGLAEDAGVWGESPF